jgi:hypothetical protein
VNEYVVRHGRRIEVEILNSNATPIKKRTPFKTEWAKLPRRWVEALWQSRSVNTYQLALAILFEAYKRKHIGGDIVLSSALVKMPRNTRMRAARELVRLGLIQIKQDGKQASRVLVLYY